MDPERLKRTLREYHSFKNVFDILFWRLNNSFKKTSLEWVENETLILMRIFAEAKQCYDCIDAETTEEEKKEIHWKTITDKWKRHFEKQWLEYMERKGSRLSIKT